MAWRISRELVDRLCSEAAASPAQEVCGLLFGQPGVVESALAAPNVATSPEDSFEIDPATLITAHRAERAGGPRLVGSYHSHPNGRRTPSPRDAEAGLAGLCLILAEAGIWAWAGDGAGGFVPIDLSVLPADSSSSKDGAVQGI